MSEETLVSLDEVCSYVRVVPGVDDDLLLSFVRAATARCQHYTRRNELTVGGTDDGKFDPITQDQFELIKLWIKAQCAYWYNNRESAGAKQEIQPSFHYLLDAVMTYA
jgi:hypothetical protein